MSSTDSKSKEDILAARKAKKLAKQNTKSHGNVNNPKETKLDSINSPTHKEGNKTEETPSAPVGKISPKGKDEVDKAAVSIANLNLDAGDKSNEQIKAERAAKKLAKQAKKKGLDTPTTVIDNVTTESVVRTLTDIVEIANEVQQANVKVNELLMKLKLEKPEETGKSKAELKAERRAKQEAQRAAKLAAQKPTTNSAANKPEAKTDVAVKEKTEVKSPKTKTLEKSKTKSQIVQKMNWFQHLHTGQDEDSLNKLPLNNNLHPAIIKLGVQLSSRVVMGSNARCIALLDALKKMITDYALPAKTEFARGLEAHLTASLDYLWSMRQPSASQTNAIKYIRYHLTKLPNNIKEFDAKKLLHEEIDRYIREQIEMAGEAISIAVRNKISNGDTILTYGCSSLIERILCEAWHAGVRFSAVVVGHRASGAGHEMLRRLQRAGLPCSYVDLTGISYAMKNVSKVVVGAECLLANGWVLAAAGTAQVALAARAHTAPLLVACETHKVSERVLTDAFAYNELGNPDDLINKNDENSPLKDWRSNPNLTLLNLTYDVTPPSLVTAVVTELAILPCTSAPVVLRFKLSEYSI